MHGGPLLRRSLALAFVLAGAALLAFGIVHLTGAATARSSALDPPVHLFGTKAPLGRLYSPLSPFNRLIPAGAALDPSSDEQVAGLAGAVRRGGAVIAVGRWTVPAYLAGAHTKRYRVTLTADWSPAHALTGVPIPAAARPDPAGDGHLAIIDRRQGCEYDFWKARKSDSSWSAEWGNSVRLQGAGVFPRGFSARGSGFALLAGVIWPDELARGRIDHALIFGYPDTAAGGFVAPATESDGQSTDPAAIPEGARLQLDPAFDVSTLPAWERPIARALQRYGMFLADNGGGNFQLYAVNPRSYPHDPYAGLLPGGNYVQLHDIPFERFRVLAHGPLTRNASALVPSGCGKFR